MENDNTNSVGDSSVNENICSLIYCNVDILVLLTVQ